MLSISGTKITMTRGDTAYIQLTLTDAEGQTYTPAEGDAIRFAVKKAYSDSDTVILLDIPTDTLLLTINPSDTASLDFGKYKYDIQITFADGSVDTFIDRATLEITAEVV